MSEKEHFREQLRLIGNAISAYQDLSKSYLELNWQPELEDCYRQLQALRQKANGIKKHLKALAKR